MLRTQGFVQVTDSVPPVTKDSVIQPQRDSVAVPIDTAVPVKKTVRPPMAAPKRDNVTETTSVIPEADSITSQTDTDTLSLRPLGFTEWKMDPSVPLTVQALQHHPFFSFGAKPQVVHSGLKEFKGKELLFYVLIAYLLAFALLRQAFPKYFNDLFRLFFRTTMKQRQIKDQLVQTPLPSLLLNIYFVLSTGLYADILFQHFEVSPVDNFWVMFFYCCLGLAVIYSLKFVGIKVSGWLFNMNEAANTYNFVIFLINKVIGIFLLPFLVLLSFMQGTPYMVALVLSWCGVGMLVVYRFLLTYASIRKQVRFNPFHFFLYLCAFEIAPLLLIYKALIFFFR
jgi:hypothetical protein